MREKVLVTGASTGIGLALVKKLIVLDKYKLLITARNTSLHRFSKESINESENIKIRSLDINNYIEQEKLIFEISKEWEGIDILINNAGLSYRACLEDMHFAEELNQIQTNYLGPVNLIRLVLPYMRHKRKGHIINISSVGGMMAMPTMASYSASKFALEGASESLYYEIKPWNIHVSLIQPGFVQSDGFQKVVYSTKSFPETEEKSDYKAHYEQMSRFIETWMKKAIGTPESIADKIIKAMQMKNPPLRIPATPEAWLFYYMRRFLPRSLYHYILYKSLPGVREWGKE